MPYIFLYLFLAVLSFKYAVLSNRRRYQKDHEPSAWATLCFCSTDHLFPLYKPFFPMPHILLPLSKISTLGVGYFFISSGFGLACSVASKPNYLRNFWKKIVDLLWITLFSSVVSTLIRNTMLGEHQIFQLVNWYMPTLTVLYLIFYVSHQHFPKKINSGVSFFFPALYSSSLRSPASLMLLQA